MLFTLLLSGLALAAPPSSTLTGSSGTLAWKVTTAGDTVTLEGRSPKWTVQHTADAQLAPKSTTRTNPDGAVTTVAWAGSTVTVTLPGGKVVTHDGAGIWDGDTLDIRLGHRVATGKPLDHTFSAVDTGSDKVYKFDSLDKGAETCAAGPCRHVNVTLAGWMKYVGPSFDYWFAADGRLVKFDGPAGQYESQ